MPLGLGCSTQLGERLKYGGDCPFLQPVIPTVGKSSPDELERNMLPLPLDSQRRSCSTRDKRLQGTLPGTNLKNAKCGKNQTSSL